MKQEKRVMALQAIGGKRWTKGTHDRIYFNSKLLQSLLGMEITRYGTGNICSVKILGERVSNTYGGKILREIENGKFYYDVVEDKFVSSVGSYTDEIIEEIEKRVEKIIEG